MSDPLKGSLFIVFGMEHYNPLGIIRSLGKNGFSPVFIALKGKSTVSSKSKYVKINHFANTVEDGFQILMEEYGQYHETHGKKPFVIVSDDDIQSCMDYHYEELKDRFVLFNAGANGRVTEFMDKKAILDLAKKHGLKTLETCVVKRGTLPGNIRYPIITKSISPNIGGWKSDVYICECEDELSHAFQHIQSPQVLIQRFIDKKNEYCLDGFSIDKGRQVFIPIASTYNYLLRGYYSPYMTVSELKDEDMKKKLRGMLEEIGFEGIFSIEFLIDQDDNYYFSEINFRNSTWSYIATLLGMPLPVLWAEGMLTNQINPDWYKRIPENYTAMVEPIDYGKRVSAGKTDLADWLIDFKEANCLFYLDPDDREPFREMVNNWEKLS